MCYRSILIPTDAGYNSSVCAIHQQIAPFNELKSWLHISVPLEGGTSKRSPFIQSWECGSRRSEDQESRWLRKEVSRKQVVCRVQQHEYQMRKLFRNLSNPHLSSLKKTISRGQAGWLSRGTHKSSATTWSYPWVCWSWITEGIPHTGSFLQIHLSKHLQSYNPFSYPCSDLLKKN